MRMSLKRRCHIKARPFRRQWSFAKNIDIGRIVAGLFTNDTITARI